ncbi:MAG: tetratricopeptide repeat protein [Saprospiraceae bacterium]|nr:tetratricopeptide repeat protein [Saprospiraceae bacterium]
MARLKFLPINLVKDKIKYSLMIGFILPVSLMASTDNPLSLQSIQDSIQKTLYSNPDKALEFALAYVEKADLQDSMLYKGKGRNFLGMVQYVKGDLDAAIKNYLAAMDIFEELEDVWFVSMLYNNIGAVYQVRKQPLETIKYYEKALKGFEEIKDSLWMANLYNNISIQKNELGLYEEELTFKTQALQIYESQNNEEMVIFTQGNMAHTFFKLGDHDQAIKYAEIFLKSANAQTDPAMRTTILLAYSYALLAKKNIDASLEAANQAREICDSLGLLGNKSKVYLQLAEIYEQKKEYRQAFEAYRNYHLLSDSLFNAEKDATIQDLIFKYDTEKKESEIVNLEAQNIQKDLLIQKSNFERAGLIAGLLAIALIAFFAWRARNIKNKANLQLQEKNEIITKALAEKNILLREIHHRVKNNLQVISSLLKLQAQYIQDENAIMAIAEGRNRVNSMALLHQNLYKDDNITGVNMEEYFSSLVEGLFDAYNVRPQSVKLSTRISPMTLDIDTVIPLGLIMNELVSNSLKHAFENVEDALLEIELWEDDSHLFLMVKDNGVGIHKSENGQELNTFGQKLIKALAEKLEAEIVTKNKGGTEIVIKVKDYKKVA